MFKENTKKIVIIGFKTLTYGLLLFTFMFLMERVNYALGERTRTAIITASSFILVLLMMQSIYGNFEIGYKKSKPVFLTTMISVLIADGIAAITMIIMGLIQFPVSQVLFPTFINLILIYLLQGLLIWVMAHLGNDLYFRMYSPAKLLILNNNDFLYKKIYRHLKSHDKQYEIIETCNDCKINNVKNNDVDLVYALGFTNGELKELIHYCYRNRITLVYDIEINEVLAGQKNTFVIDDVLLVEIASKELGLFQMFIKRFIDIVGALVLLIISSPIILVTAIAIKLDDGGPIFYSQERLTQNGRVFKIYKFRSMKVDSGDKPVEKDDDRITPVGHRIRKMRIDELPQVVNILKGDISLVGPRPESKAHAQKIMKVEPDFDLRLRVKAGLTGYAQIFGKYNTTPQMKLLLDLYYIENYTVLEDFKLILQTLMVFVRPDSTEAFDTEDDLK